MNKLKWAGVILLLAMALYFIGMTLLQGLRMM